MGKSPATAAREQTADTAARGMREAYGVGIPLMRQQQQYLNQGLATGEPQYMKDAYAMQRGILGNAMNRQGQQAQGAADLATSGLRQGGNYASSTLSPMDMGAQLANQLYSSRTSEALGAIEQQNKMMGMALGQGQAAGSAALDAGMNQLNAIGMMQQYNPTYAAILGGVNLAGSIYGGGSRPGWWGGGGGTGSGGGGGGQTAGPWARPPA